MSEINSNVGYDFHREDASYDPGIAEIEMVIKQANHANDEDDDLATSHDFLRTVLEQANTMWPYHGSRVTMSAKVYLTEQDFAATVVPAEWGEPLTDSQGIYYIIDRVVLISHGIVDATNYATAEDGSAMKVAYGYSFSDIDSEQHALVINPDEIISVEYPFLTDDGIDFRLHSDYPDIMNAVDEIIPYSPYDCMEALQSIKQACAVGSELLNGSKELRGWMLRYLHDQVEFDRETEYVFVFKGLAFIIDETGERQIQFPENTPPQFAKVTDIGVHNGADGLVPYLMLDIPASYYVPENLRESAYVPFSSIVSMASIRPPVSWGEVLGQGESDAEGYITDVPAILPGTETIKIDPVEFSERYRVEVIGKGIERALQLVKFKNEIRYTTQEEAIQAAHELTQQLAMILDEHGVTLKDRFAVSGPGSYVGNIIQKTGGDVAIAFSQDSDDPLKELAIGEDFNGTYLGVYPNITQSESTDELEADTYKIRPVLALSDATKEFTMSAMGVSMMKLSLDKRILVPLDGTANLEHQELYRYQRADEALAELDRLAVVPESIAAARLLKVAFDRLTQFDWQSCDVTALHQVAKSITGDGAQDDDFVYSFSKLFSGRTVELHGDFFSNEGAETATEKHCTIQGMTLDGPYNSGYGLCFVVTDGSRAMSYVPLASISEMKA